jgi:hypothetical protein
MVKIRFALYLIKYHAVKKYWESGDIAPRITETYTLNILQC